jgi:hypothetical protein
MGQTFVCGPDLSQAPSQPGLDPGPLCPCSAEPSLLSEPLLPVMSDPIPHPPPTAAEPRPVFGKGADRPEVLRSSPVRSFPSLTALGSGRPTA